MSTHWISAMDDEGTNPLERAFQSGHMVIADLLLLQERMDKEDVPQKSQAGDATPYFGLESAARALLSANDPGARGRKTGSALHRAARDGNVESATYEADECDVNGISADGMTPLHWACLRGDLHMAECLLEAGADPTIRNEALDGLSARDLAQVMGYTELTELLSAREAFI